MSEKIRKPRDLDAIQAHEAEQQRLVEAIISDLHRETSEEDNYIKIFYSLAKNLLEKLDSGASLAKGEQRHDAEYMVGLVLKPIREFTKNDTEKRYLILKVHEKVMDSIASRIVSEYQREEMGL